MSAFASVAAFEEALATLPARPLYGRAPDAKLPAA